MFRTELNPVPLPEKINLKHPILTIGSCFSETIGNQLTDHKFNTCINPFGTIYNPISIHQLIELALYNRLPDESGYAQREDVHVHYQFHSRFAALNRTALEDSIKKALSETHHFLQSAKWIMITYGTSWVYRLKSDNTVVANCHKMPGQLFGKELLSPDTIIASFDALYSKVKSVNPGLQILLTVSPVRHVRDTLELNSVSKSILRMVCYSVSTAYADVYYFPAYELLLDDLRDYRFYASDLIHPSEEASRYIWQKFTEACMDEGTRNFISEWSAIRQALLHKPFVPGSRSHRQFVESTVKKLEKLKNMVSIEHEVETLLNQMHEPKS